MIVLRDEHVQYILKDLESKGILMEELRFSLLDHICCLLEEELSEPYDFREEYEKVLPRFFKRELHEIQQETELLIQFKNYYAMKRTMLISAAVTAFTFIVGALFKFMFWPGASFLILVSIVNLCFVFLPILFLFKTKETNSVREKIILGVATLFGIAISLATLFKIMHWPGANVMWLSSLGFLFFVFLPLFFLSGIRKPETKFNTIISSVLILVSIGLLFALTQLKSSKWTDYTEIRTDIELMEVAESSLEDVKASAEVNDQASQVKKQIHLLKKGLVNHMRRLSSSAIYDLLRDMGKDINQTNSYFFKESGQAKPELSKLSNEVKELCQLLPDNVKSNLSILNTDKRKRYNDSEEEMITWEEEHFSHVTLSVALRNLSVLELSIEACK
jgi:hypothetical protein